MDLLARRSPLLAAGTALAALAVTLLQLGYLAWTLLELEAFTSRDGIEAAK